MAKPLNKDFDRVSSALDRALGRIPQEYAARLAKTRVPPTPEERQRVRLLALVKRLRVELADEMIPEHVAEALRSAILETENAIVAVVEKNP